MYVFEWGQTYLFLNSFIYRLLYTLPSQCLIIVFNVEIWQPQSERAWVTPPAIFGAFHSWGLVPRLGTTYVEYFRSAQRLLRFPESPQCHNHLSQCEGRNLAQRIITWSQTPDEFCWCCCCCCSIFVQQVETNSNKSRTQSRGEGLNTTTISAVISNSIMSFFILLHLLRPRRLSPVRCVHPVHWFCWVVRVKMRMWIWIWILWLGLWMTLYRSCEMVVNPAGLRSIYGINSAL